MKLIKKFLTIITFICITGVCLASDDISVNARVDKTKIYMDGQIIYTITISGSSGLKGSLELPDFRGFNFRSRGSSKSFTMINGEMSSSSIYTYLLMPKSPGKYTISQVSLERDGQFYKSDPIEVEVIPGAQPARMSYDKKIAPAGGFVEEEQESLDDNFKVEILVDKNECYINEQIIMTFKFYVGGRILNDPEYKAPETPGFWQEKLGEEAPVFENINGQRYSVARVKTALFPIKSGELEIQPTNLTIIVPASSQRDSDDFFDKFLNSSGFFASNRGVRKVLRTNPVKVNVLPLPELNKPADFSGAVGKFKITSGLDKQTVNTGDPVTLNITVTGEGNLNSIKLPDLSNIKDFDVYESEQKKLKDKIDFEVILIPKKPGSLTIPQINFNYFDPEDKQYKYLYSDAKNIDVQKSKDYTPQKQAEIVDYGARVPDKEDIKILKKDIRHLKPDIGDAFSNNLFGIDFRILLGILCFFPLLIIFRFFLSLKAMSEEKNMALFKERRALRTAMDNFKSTEKFMEKSNHERFYQSISEIIRGYIADKLHFSSTSITIKDIEFNLNKKKVDEKRIKSLTDLLEKSDFARFASEDINKSEMKKDFNEAKAIIKKLSKFLLFFVIAISCVKPAYAKENLQYYFNQAEKFYLEKNYESSINMYEKILNAGKKSGNIYYNIGNCYFRINNYAKAMLYYERAKRLIPRDKDLINNIDLINSQYVKDNVELKRWWVFEMVDYIADFLNFQVWVLISLILYALLGLIIFIYIGKNKRLAYYMGIILICSSLLSAHIYYRDYYIKQAVILNDDVHVKSSPSEDFDDVFVLNLASKVQVIGSEANWLNIRLGNGLEGWVLKESIELL